MIRDKSGIAGFYATITFLLMTYSHALKGRVSHETD